MSIQKQYSTIDNISISGGNIFFDVTANDTFDIIGVYYNNSERYCKGLGNLDITNSFTETTLGDANSGRIELCLSSTCEFGSELSQYPFTEVLNLFTIITSENPNEDCIDCDQDTFQIFDYLGELNKLGEKILNQFNSCNCVDVKDCDLEKGFLLELINTQDKVNTVTESVEFYKKYKDLCCD